MCPLPPPPAKFQCLFPLSPLWVGAVRFHNSSSNSYDLRAIPLLLLSSLLFFCVCLSVCLPVCLSLRPALQVPGPRSPGWPCGRTRSLGAGLVPGSPFSPAAPGKPGLRLHRLLLASLAPRRNYLRGGPWHTGAAPRSPRFPRATGVPSPRPSRRVCARRSLSAAASAALRSGTATRSRSRLFPRAQADSATRGLPRPGLSRGPSAICWRIQPPQRWRTEPAPTGLWSSDLHTQTWVPTSQGCPSEGHVSTPFGKRHQGQVFRESRRLPFLKL